MSLYIASLNSGSNGNCYYVGNESDAVLVDVGISCRETERRMKMLGLPTENLRAIFISHEHTDHIKGLALFSKKHGIPVYMTHKTYRHNRFDIEPNLLHLFEPSESFFINNLRVQSFSKRHDAVEPVSFVISHNETNIGVFTDIGSVCETLIHHFSQCHAAFLEANYDTDMLRNGHYPEHLKRRISSGKGHLSNTEALDLFVRHKPAYMQQLILSHLSAENNCPVLVENLFTASAGNIAVSVASRKEASALFHIRGHEKISPAKFKSQKEEQLSLF